MKRNLLLNSEAKGAVAPQSTAAGTVTGGIFNKESFLSGILTLVTGAVTGTPTSLTVTATINTSDAVDDEDAPTSLTDPSSTDVSLVLDAANSIDQLDIDFLALKRWNQISVTAAFVDGTTPEVSVSGLVMLGDSQYSEDAPETDVFRPTLS